MPDQLTTPIPDVEILNLLVEPLPVAATKPACGNGPNGCTCGKTGCSCFR